MWTFLKGIWHFLHGVKKVTTTVIVLGGLALVLNALFSGEKLPTVPSKGTLQLALNGYIVEQRAQVDSLLTLTNPEHGNLPAQTLLRDVLDAINLAAQDKRIAALSLELNNFAGAGPATLDTIGEALEKFKRAGKPVYAHALLYDNKSYALAAHANRISLDPMGAVLINGYGSYQLYMKEALDKLKINVHVFRVGKYKSAVEPYTRSDMSPEAREEYEALFGVLWEKYKQDIQALRGPGLDLQAVIDQAPQGVVALNGDVARYALNHKLVDVLATRQQYEAELAKIGGTDEDEDDIPTYSKISLDDYLAAARPAPAKGGDAVAVIYAVGEIVDGEHPAGVAGGDTVAHLIRKAAADSDTRAIVLRIDSPGGSVTGSEAIRRALEDARARDIPVVASMGTLAASGGYWIATGADEIFAQPTTITGSIGIFGIIPTFENTAALLGLKSDGVGTTIFSSAEDITRAFSEPVEQLIQATVNHGYDVFLSHVSKARKLSIAQVNDVAQGRVWAGATAHQLKLVDRFGTLDDAVAAAAKRAELQSWRTSYVEEPESLQTRLIRMLTGHESHEKNSTVGGFALLPLTEQLAQASLQLTGKSLRDGNNLYAYCAECAVLSTPNLSPTRLRLARDFASRLGFGTR